MNKVYLHFHISSPCLIQNLNIVDVVSYMAHSNFYTNAEARHAKIVHT